MGIYSFRHDVVGQFDVVYVDVSLLDVVEGGRALFLYPDSTNCLRLDGPTPVRPLVEPRRPREAKPVKSVLLFTGRSAFLLCLVAKGASNIFLICTWVLALFLIGIHFIYMYFILVYY